MRGFGEIRECERPGDSTGPTTFSEEAMKKYKALFAEDIKPSEKEEALDALNRKIRGQESVAGTLVNQITESCARFASTADEKKTIAARCEQLGITDPAIKKCFEQPGQLRKLSVAEMLESAMSIGGKNHEDTNY